MNGILMPSQAIIISRVATIEAVFKHPRAVAPKHLSYINNANKKLCFHSIINDNDNLLKNENNNLWVCRPLLHFNEREKVKNPMHQHTVVPWPITAKRCCEK